MSETNNKQLTANYNAFKTFFENNKGVILDALPKHLDIDRVLRVALTDIRKNPKLLECSLPSVFASLVNASMLGLEIGNGLGHAYLVPFFDSKKKTWEAQLIIGYRGMIDLARRSGQVISISAQPVYESDFFEFEYGLTPKLRHIPKDDNNNNPQFKGAYAVVHLKDGGNQFVFLPRHKIEAIKNTVLGKIKNEYAKNYSPWTTAFDEMAKKTCVRALFKYLPVSIEIQRAVSIDEQTESFVNSSNSASNNADLLGISSEIITNDLDALASQLDDIPGFDNETGELKNASGNQ